MLCFFSNYDYKMTYLSTPIERIYLRSQISIMKKLGILLMTCLLLVGLEASAQTRLVKSIKAPNIATKDVLGNKINLQTMVKDKQVLICFFRPIWCPICNHRTHELIKAYDELKKKGIEVIAIYPTNAESMAEYVKDAKIPFTVISDPNEVLYKQYSIERSMKKAKATMGQDGIMDVVKKGMELFGGKQYDEKSEKYMDIISADFLVGAKRNVKVAYYGEHVADHYSLEKL